MDMVIGRMFVILKPIKVNMNISKMQHTYNDWNKRIWCGYQWFLVKIVWQTFVDMMYAVMAIVYRNVLSMLNLNM